MGQLTGRTAVAPGRGLLGGGTSSRPVIEVEGLTVDYGDFRAVKDLSFQVQRGELYALLGTNGAGKTSALEVIEGHRAASSGTVRVFGESPTNRATVRPRMGIMLQESGFAADLTVAETVRLIGRLTGRSDRVDRVLNAVDLTRKAGTRVEQLSGGEKRRLDFATAVYGRPELVILDEPTTGLDPASRAMVEESLWELTRGRTTVAITHDLSMIRELDRILWLERGQIVEDGSPAQLLANPRSRVAQWANAQIQGRVQPTAPDDGPSPSAGEDTPA